MASQNALLGSFSSGLALGTSAGKFSTTMKMLPVKSQEFGHKNSTGLRNGAVESKLIVDCQ